MSSFQERGERAHRLGLIGHLIDMNNLDLGVYAHARFSAMELLKITPGIATEKDPHADLDPKYSRLVDESLYELTDRTNIYMTKPLFPEQ